MRFASLLLLSVGAFLCNAPAHGLTLQQITPLTNMTHCGAGAVSYRVDNFNGRCTSAQIEVKAGSTVVQTIRVREHEEFAVDPSGSAGKIWVNAYCGSDRVSKYYFRDVSAPTFAAFTLDGASSGWVNSPAALAFVNVVDDGNFPNDFEARITVDGSFYGHFPIQGASLTLSEGEHRVRVRLEDGCNRRSASSDVVIKVDNSAPTASFVKPDADQVVRRGSNLLIDVGLGDPGSSSSGLSQAIVYLDSIPDEFNSGMQLCRFSAPWIAGLGNRKNCTVSTSSWARGNHRLFLIVTDRARNQTTVQRGIRLE